MQITDFQEDDSWATFDFSSYVSNAEDDANDTPLFRDDGSVCIQALYRFEVTSGLDATPTWAPRFKWGDSIVNGICRLIFSGSWVTSEALSSSADRIGMLAIYNAAGTGAGGLSTPPYATMRFTHAATSGIIVVHRKLWYAK